MFCRKEGELNPSLPSAFAITGGKPIGAKMNQWLLNLPAYESYLIAIPAIMVGSVLLVGAIVLLFEPHDESERDARHR